MNLQEFFREGYYRRYIKYVVVVIVLYLLLRGCLPASGELPQEAYNEIQDRYLKCLRPESAPTYGWWSQNEPERYECGQVDVEVIGEGTVPEDEQAQGIKRAICIQAAIHTPYWTIAPPSVSGQGVVQSGEIRTKTRTANKVITLQNGVWQLTPDEDALDEERWEKYACPGEYGDSTK